MELHNFFFFFPPNWRGTIWFHAADPLGIPLGTLDPWLTQPGSECVCQPCMPCSSAPFSPRYRLSWSVDTKLWVPQLWKEQLFEEKVVIFINYHGKHHEVQHYETHHSFPGSVGNCLKAVSYSNILIDAKKRTIFHTKTCPSGGKASKSDSSALCPMKRDESVQSNSRVTQRTQYPCSPTYFDASPCLPILKAVVP